MDDQTNSRLTQIETKIDQIYKSVESTRNYFKWTLILSVVVILIPVILATFLLPQLTSILSSQVNSLSTLTQPK